ncbi:MAG: head-tail connector protein [Beijerinckiaceae bacterium]|nr:head-tail connector protein [Beijerinckiaceae bacterium]MCZ8298655.1 head-tail connector protein [Beijerinckiaceae bacterium]
MIPIMIEGPALEPVSLAEARLWLRVEDPAEDELIAGLAVAARLMVEAEIGQVLLGQTWRLIGHAWPADGRIPVRTGPVLAVRGGRVFHREGHVSELPPAAFRLLPFTDPPVIEALLTPLPGRPSAGIEIDLRLGHGEAAADVPAQIRLAIRRLVALWYENRGEGGESQPGMPPQIRALLRPFRRARLGGRP